MSKPLTNLPGPSRPPSLVPPRPIPNSALPYPTNPQQRVTGPPAPAPGPAPTAAAPKQPVFSTDNVTMNGYPNGIIPTHMSRSLDSEIALPEDVKLPEADIFEKLKAMNAHMDYGLKRTQLRFQSMLPDQAYLHTTTTRILRFTVSTTHEGQAIGRQLSAMGTAKEASWSIRLSGRLLDAQGRVMTGTGVRKMSSFFKSIIVQLDRNEFPNQWNMAWTKSKSADDVDTFTFTRKSTKESLAKIYLHLTDGPSEKYAVSEVLQRAVGLTKTEYTRAEVLVAVWKHVREHNLQDSTKRSRVKCDEALMSAFELEAFDYDDLPELITMHLAPAEAIPIVYPIRFFKDPRESEVTYDIPVEIENPQAALNLNTHQAQITELNRQIMDNLDRFNSKKRKREFYLEFATDPLNFLEQWLTSQRRDQALATHKSLTDAQNTDFYLQPLAAAAAHDYAIKLPTRTPQQVPFSHDFDQDAS